MSARPWSGRLALGGGRLEESPLAVVAGQEPALVADGQGIVRELVDEDRTADVVGAVASGWQLKHEPLEAHSAVVTHGALMLTREHEAQIHGDEADERALGLRGLHREAAVEVGDERRGEIRVGRSVVRDPGDAELLGKAALELPKFRSLRPRAFGVRARMCRMPRALRARATCVSWASSGGPPAVGVRQK